MQETFVATDPYYTDLEPEEWYSVIGIINCQVEIKHINTGLILFRVPLQLGIEGIFSQAIIEVWAKKGFEEPFFTKKWESLQLAYFRGIKFIGKRNEHGLEFFHFELPTRKKSPRYIWLSSDDKKFWSFPVANPETRRFYSLFPKFTGENAPFEGILRSSNGAVFSDKTDKICQIHTRSVIGNATFKDFYVVVLAMKEEMISKAGKQIRSNKDAFFKVTSGPFYMQM